MISLYYDYILLLFNFLRNFRVKYQESSIGFENLAHFQFIENKCQVEPNEKLNAIVTFLLINFKYFSYVVDKDIVF